MERERDERIRERAHQIWEREGRQEGNHDAHWHRAERELDEEERDGAAGTPQDESRQMVGEASSEGSARRRR